MRHLLPGLFLLAAVVNLLPLVGALSAERLAVLYGVTVDLVACFGLLVAAGLLFSGPDARGDACRAGE